jgi:hypothetical protein
MTVVTVMSHAKPQAPKCESHKVERRRRKDRGQESVSTVLLVQRGCQVPDDSSGLTSLRGEAGVKHGV